jgi:predicted CXXCH cytochrome family protein
VRTLIRFLARTPGGTVESRDRIVDGDAITLGRATDRTLHLKDSRVALEHARIYRSGGRTLITCKPPAQVILNGTVRRDAELQIGDTLQIGANMLRLIEPDKGLDLAFTFELDATADARAGVVDRPRLSLNQLGMYKRRWAWIAFIACLGLGLLIPLAGSIRKDGSETLRGLNLPSDRAWLPGPLHASHATLNGRCEACHETPFVRVRSEACLTCHSANLHTHVRSMAAVPVAMERLGCTSCHAEHEEPARLVQTDQRLCATCHSGNVISSVAAARALNATDFLLDHPDFDVRARPSHPLEGRQNESGLHFAHDVHLDAKGIKTPDRTVVMTCADCHRPEPGGAHMQPVRMETHCASCHRLEFDPSDPDRTVPHGDPKRVMDTLVEYYSARYLAGYPDPRASAQPARRVQLPAIALSAPERSRLLQLARARADEVARDLFERRVCVECHDVIRVQATDGETWHVADVRRIEAWMPSAHFDHSRHGTALTPCSTCHDAEHSKKESDVLMPRIDTCRTCHGGERPHPGNANLIASTCTMCHSFHQAPNPFWVKPAAQARNGTQ